MNSPKISVIMPVYNAVGFLKESVLSVLRQTYEDFELIAVDDCSTDGSYELLLSLSQQDKRIKPYKNECNRGVSYTRNFGVAKSQCGIIALIDSDDMWEKDKLSYQLKLMLDNPDVPITYTGSSFIDADSKKSEFIFHVPQKVGYKRLLCQNVISCSSVMIRKEYLQKYPMAGDNMHEDFAVWLSVLKEGNCALGIDEPLLIYRVAKNSKSGNKLKSAMMTYRVYKYIGLNPFSRLFHMIAYTINGVKKYRGIEK